LRTGTPFDGARYVRKRILMIASHFPPFRGGSGVHRTTTFSRYLLEDHGWEPTVLTVDPRVYRNPGDDLMADVADGVRVVRTFGLDVPRLASVCGVYPSWLELPDRWWTWRIGAVRAGLRIIREWRPSVLWSTSPMATGHWIGLALRRRTGLPWIADFRDPMTGEHHPEPRLRWRVCRGIERRTVHESSRAVFTTRGALGMHRARYPEAPADRFALIENGYDERRFAVVGAVPARSGGPLVLLHSGLLYRSERDPRPFFEALGDLRRAGIVAPEGLRVVLRASGDEEHYRRLIERSGVQGIVRLEEPRSHREALAEMLSADGLLLFQASRCNHQIPAKAYEYLRARRPILALTDPSGDTADLLRRAGTGAIVPLDSRERIAEALPGFLDSIRAGVLEPACDEEVARHSRRARAGELASLLDDLLAARRAPRPASPVRAG
jgi:glycosyltransferase involved in cell wall biosynthesis